MAGKFEVYRDTKGEYRFRLKAANGETILSGEGYTNRAACDTGIASVQTNSQDESRFERKESSNGKPYFVLKAANHQVIGQSAMYSSEAARDNGIQSVIANGATDQIDDQTA